jgi:rod shape determining protein RodA
VGWRAYLRHLDYVLIAATLALITYGVTMIYFATRDDPPGPPLYFVTQQLTAVVLGAVAAAVVSLFDYEVYRRFQWVFYAAAVVLLAAVLPLGIEVKGATRWFDLGFTRLQPSALALLLLALSIGAYLADRMDLLGSKRVTLVALAMMAVPALLVYREPDFGSAMVIVALTLAMLYFYGTSWTHFAVLAGTGVAALVVALKILPLAGIKVIQEYQVQRLFVFINPSHDPTGSGWNILQSMIAVGSGALRGRGDMATQTALDFLPEHHTDFIFAVLSERNGFLGALLLIALYGIVIWRCLRIATLSRDMYGSILAGGIGVMFLFQVFVNIGMTIGIMPVTGIPLPFVSYGGTAMIAFLMFVGLLEAIHVRATVTPSNRGRFVQ